MGEAVPNPNTLDNGGAVDFRERILDAALALAEEKGRWSAVRLHDVANRLSISASQVLDHYRDLDAVALTAPLPVASAPLDWPRCSGRWLWKAVNPLVSALKTGDDLLLYSLFEFVNLLKPVHLLIDLPRIGSDIPRTRRLLTLQED